MKCQIISELDLQASLSPCFLLSSISAFFLVSLALLHFERLHEILGQSGVRLEGHFGFLVLDEGLHIVTQKFEH